MDDNRITESSPIWPPAIPLEASPQPRPAAKPSREYKIGLVSVRASVYGMIVWLVAWAVLALCLLVDELTSYAPQVTRTGFIGFVLLEWTALICGLLGRRTLPGKSGLIISLLLLPLATVFTAWIRATMGFWIWVGPR